MKVKNRIIAMCLIIVVLVLSLCSCGRTDDFTPLSDKSIRIDSTTFRNSSNTTSYTVTLPKTVYYMKPQVLRGNHTNEYADAVYDEYWDVTVRWCLDHTEYSFDKICDLSMQIDNKYSYCPIYDAKRGVILLREQTFSFDKASLEDTYTYTSVEYVYPKVVSFILPDDSELRVGSSILNREFPGIKICENVDEEIRVSDLIQSEFSSMFTTSDSVRGGFPEYKFSYTTVYTDAIWYLTNNF